MRGLYKRMRYSLSFAVRNLPCSSTRIVPFLGRCGQTALERIKIGKSDKFNVRSPVRFALSAPNKPLASSRKSKPGRLKLPGHEEPEVHLDA